MSKIGEIVEGFGEMDVTQIGTHRYRVTSWRNAGQTTHVVDLHEGTCECADQTYNRDGAEACAHFLKVNHVAETRLSVEEQTAEQLGALVTRAQQAVREIEDVRDVSQAAQTANAQAAAETATDNSSDEPELDPAEALEDRLRTAGLDPDAFSVWIDDQHGSLQVEQDGYLEDGSFQTWVDVSDELKLRYDGDNDRNYLPSDEFGEVLG